LPIKAPPPLLWSKIIQNGRYNIKTFIYVNEQGMFSLSNNLIHKTNSGPLDAIPKAQNEDQARTRFVMVLKRKRFRRMPNTLLPTKKSKQWRLLP
jgi:hypothetical protein